MEVRKAKTSEYRDVRAFYHSLIDAMADAEFGVGWIKDIYPAPEFYEVPSQIHLTVSKIKEAMVACLHM